jgi:1,2-diacylglycerol 3-beta-galactosyltransferase
MILNPRFYNYSPIDRAAERTKAGLDATRMTGLVLFGGQGARKKMLDIDRRLSESGLEIQLILICGKNERLLEELRVQARAIPRLVEGFTTNMPYYMQLADFFIGKPGPGSIAEALAMGLPVIVEKNAWTLPQERYNAVWVRENELGLVVRNFETVVDAVAQLLEPETFARFRCNAKKMNNRALFEIPDILSCILSESNN